MTCRIQNRKGIRMSLVYPRRNILKLASLALPLGSGWRESTVSGFETPVTGRTFEAPVNDSFPTQTPELVREMVTVSHFDLNRVKELVEARPSLARAAWDWGFGDWETALGAASHMGNRGIAEYLIQKGARPSLFSATMLGQVDVVKAFVAAQPGVQRIEGPHGISLLSHAKAGGEASRAVLEFLSALGDADGDPPVPLAESDANTLKGIYTFGVAVNQQIEVSVEHGRLTWARRGTMGRQLFHLGERVFYPGGAHAVRIEFKEDGPTTVMTVKDPGVVLVAKRAKEK